MSLEEAKKALIFAVYNNDLDTIRKALSVLEHDEDIDLYANIIEDVAQIAIKNGNLEMLKLLVENHNRVTIDLMLYALIKQKRDIASYIYETLYNTTLTGKLHMEICVRETCDECATPAIKCNRNYRKG